MNCKDFPEMNCRISSSPPEPEAQPGRSWRTCGTCPPCTEELTSPSSSTFSLSWTLGPPRSPARTSTRRCTVRIREEQAQPRRWAGLRPSRLADRLLFNTGHQFRPAVAGALALVLAHRSAGGSFAGLNWQLPAQFRRARPHLGHGPKTCRSWTATPRPSDQLDTAPAG